MDDSKRARKEHGVRATNQEFGRYEQVEKRQEYALAEGGRAEEFDEEYRIRTVDIAPYLRGGDAEAQAFARELGRALQDIGFAILVGHGVAPALFERVEAAIARLFTGHALAEKQRFAEIGRASCREGEVYVGGGVW